ncbi:hypothetical protein CAOG_08680 [Capsaspora owczarzaki ATCC 30864]|uniref:hypothetical protein n=1 Tax=Capsaspora owczarzaki (strain ATCC 30864) TaxID=595528 RepID=UPI0003525F2A|nr:hypothetical protein CAOG_08680 [Capsaspora owczarzaki ATCC 30864]|eukprot:XP_011270291.1 hypothetical protein CAOG_08680 [Capsaspora owczarzaki ATCC 30864]
MASQVPTELPVLSFDEIRGELEPSMQSVSKIMCANRGEIAIRVFRAAHELSLRTVAIYSLADRFAMHRSKADEAYEVSGPNVTPVGAYLDVDRIVALAVKSGVRAIHPGYGFLSENSTFARAVEKAGIVFVGPDPDVIDKMGDKTQARTAAIECGVPVVPGSNGPVPSLEAAEAFVKQHGLPVIIKAAFGGGGRGMRVIRNESELSEGYLRCTSEAKSAFGDGTVFIERYIENPRHIEVQILADNYGNVVHLFERDCSVQRRHQKVIEVAPAVNLPTNVRDAILESALKLARHIKYRNAGTVEFLVDPQHRHYFIEVNPRIQVEHTITEQITGVDLVASQIRIAAGASLESLGLQQSNISVRGHSIQCRVTAEDPANNFMPDTGKIVVYRTSSGNGIRLDGGAGFAGSIITPHYDSLLVKIISHASTYQSAIRKLLRAITECRIRGVKTNIPFLQKVLLHPEFLQGVVHTGFIDNTKELFNFPVLKNRAQKLLTFLGEICVNGSAVQGMVGEPGPITPKIPTITNLPDPMAPPPAGWRDILLAEGPEGFAKKLRAHKNVLITDTTWRDAHQSHLMTRMRTYDMAAVAPHTAHVMSKAFSLEMWGGATFDVSLRFLHECPWDRLRQLRALVPNIPFQMLLRGANAVGYTTYPDNVVFEFVKTAKDNGVDIFRVFDSLNYVENLRLGIDAVRAAGGVIEAAICYTGDVLNPKRPKYNLPYYIGLVEKLVEMGIHILAIKDMAGLLKPHAATVLIGAIRTRWPDLPIHVHTHDTAGTGVASMIAAAQAGADVVDVATDAMSGLTSQPCMGAVVTSLNDLGLGEAFNFDQLQDLNGYWGQVRAHYRCFDSEQKASSSDVYQHEMPGGQYTNLFFQSMSLGLSEQWGAIKTSYAAANRLLGDIVKVTPSSKVVGDLAQFMVANELDEEKVIAQADRLSFPSSVVQYFQGLIGIPEGGFPEPLRTKIVRNLPCVQGRPGANMPALDLVKLKRDLVEQFGSWITDTDVMSAAMYPEVFKEYALFVNHLGNVGMVPTFAFLKALPVGEELVVDIEAGKRLYIKLIAVGTETDQRGMREVFFELNGEARKISVPDRSIAVAHVTRAKASADMPNEVGCPMSGTVIELRAKVGAPLKQGDPICVLNAMKMETVVTAPLSGTLELLNVKVGESLSAGDLVARIKPAAP